MNVADCVRGHLPSAKSREQGDQETTIGRIGPLPSALCPLPSALRPPPSALTELRYRCALPSSHRPIDDQNSAATFDHLWTNPDKYTTKPETRNVIIYGPKDWNGTTDERRSTPMEERHRLPTCNNPRPSAVSFFPSAVSTTTALKFPLPNKMLLSPEPSNNLSPWDETCRLRKKTRGLSKATPDRFDGHGCLRVRASNAGVGSLLSVPPCSRHPWPQPPFLAVRRPAR
jgi:hypothetical protein